MAEAANTSAKQRAHRTASLARERAVSLQERDDADSAYKQATAEIASCQELLKQAEINLNYTRVRAPVSGRIGRSFVTEGALVTQNQANPLAAIQQLSPVFVDVTQPSAQSIQLRRALAQGELKQHGQARVWLTLEGGLPYTKLSSGEAIVGQVLFSEVTVDESTGSVTLRAAFANPDGLLLPGMYVRAEIAMGERERALLVPQKCVGRDMRNRAQIYVLEPTESKELFTVATRLVTLETDHAGQWLLQSGVKAGELIMLDGHQKVRPGQKVRGELLADNR